MKNATIKPPFKWTGGKNRMRDQYRDIFAPPDGNIDTFVDMFCGACSVSLWVAENYPDAKIVLNDFNSELIELYRVFQDDYEGLEKRYLENVDKLLSFQDRGKLTFADICSYLNSNISEAEVKSLLAERDSLKADIKQLKKSKDEDSKQLLLEKNRRVNEISEVFKDYTLPWKWLRTLPTEGTPLKTLDRKDFYYFLRDRYAMKFETQTRAENAGDLLFMMRVNFNGIWKGYDICNGRYSTPPGTMTQKAAFFGVEEIRKFRDFLQKCEIHNKDFGELTEWKQPGTYYYADPPYRDCVVEYKDAFSEDDQIRLASFLKEVDEAGCWFSESNKEIGDGFWETHLGNYSIHDMSAKYTAGRGKTLKNVKEVLITNF